LISISI